MSKMRQYTSTTNIQKEQLMEIINNSDNSTPKIVYRLECPDRRDNSKPDKRFAFEICAETFLPHYKLIDPPIGGVVLAIAQMWAGYRYGISIAPQQVESELGEKIGQYLKDNYPSYLSPTVRWTKPIRDAVKQTVNGTNNVWKGQQPVPPKPKSLRVVRSPNRKT